MSGSQPIADNADKPHRKVTVAIVDKESGEALRYCVLEPTDFPYQLVDRYFGEFVKEIVPEMSRGEEREFLLYERAEGIRPTVKNVKIRNQPKTISWERSVTGHRGPSATGSETNPYSVDKGEGKVVKKGEFPRPGGDRSALFEDDGIDEDAIRTAVQHTHMLVRAALAQKFSKSARLALTAGLDELIRSTGATGDVRADWYSDPTDETAINLLDAAILLWLQSDAAHTLPPSMRQAHSERMSEDPKRAESINDIAKILERHGYL